MNNYKIVTETGYHGDVKANSLLEASVVLVFRAKNGQCPPYATLLEEVAEENILSNEVITNEHQY
jgi:hypothetical protein